MSKAIFHITHVPVLVETIENLLCSAFEGGSNYWIETCTRREKSDATYRQEHVLLPGCALEIEHEQVVKDGPTETVLDHALLVKGLGIFAEKYPQHFADMLTENDDADTGDVFLQCCLFGEIIFG